MLDTVRSPATDTSLEIEEFRQVGDQLEEGYGVTTFRSA
jgi:hypothetical protein